MLLRNQLAISYSSFKTQFKCHLFRKSSLISPRRVQCLSGHSIFLSLHVCINYTSDYNTITFIYMSRSILINYFQADELFWMSCVRNHVRIASTRDFPVTLKIQSKGAWLQSPLIMSASVLYLWGNHSHPHTCFLWADSFICLANTGSCAVLKTRLSPGNWQRGFGSASEKKNRASKLAWSQVLD